MLLNGYSVRIVGGNEIAGGYVEMQHSQIYQIVLRNNNPRKCDAQVTIDGKSVGTWRLNPYSSSTLTRPENSDGQFVFYKVGTAESVQAALSTLADNLGLVTVTFIPEMEHEPVMTASIASFDDGAVWRGAYKGGLDEGGTVVKAARSAGGTGLVGHSSQRYGQAGEIERDYSRQTTINLRLIAVDSKNDIRPLQSSNPIPPRVW